MPNIQVLPKDIAELIAAGEVIERPASVLKELTENAIDSGAKRITAELKRGGVLYMRVTDDGCGIEPDQVRTAFLRHATSKIASKEDLESIFTLGFRGEALASICAVSRTELLTRRKDAEFGTHYIIEGGEEVTFEQSGCPEGTTVVVRDLFYNVPVRAGFLKKDTAEGNAAANIFQKIALSHPEISFRLIRENKTEFVTPGDGMLYSAIYAIFGKDFARDLLPVQYEENGVTVDGFIMKPLYSRPNRSHQLFFVNGRAVRSFTCMQAIEEAYKTLIMTGKYPVCVLRVNLPPRTVDVNMHPTKAEVRFSDERRVYNAVFFAVTGALAQNHLIYEFQLPEGAQPQQTPAQILDPPRRQTDWYAPVAGQDSNTPTAPLFVKPEEPQPAPSVEIPLPPETPKLPASPRLNPPGIDTPHVVPPQPAPPPQPQPQTAPPPPPTNAEFNEALKAFPSLNAQPAQPFVPPAPAIPPVQSTPAPQPLPEEPIARNEAISEVRRAPICMIGELFDNYILAQAGDQFIMIDKHAAHERILFERFRTRACKDRQTLLTPVRVLLTADEVDALQEMEDTLENCGFTFDFAESPVVHLTGVPLSCAELDLDRIAEDLAAHCRMELRQPDAHLLDDMFHDLACKAAIRAGDHSTPKELQSLAEQVWENENIRHCPHGRPVLFLLSKYQIEKQFQRIQH